MPTEPPDPHRHWMRRAIRLAMNGRGRVEPNPLVGCVITSPDAARVLGEGFHEVLGGPHAEPNALAACLAAGNSPAGATVYTTLEPCCHTNKKTPPCVPKLIEAKVARVVIGCLDPTPAVDGKGAQLLRDAGIEVTTSVLEPQCKQLIAPFIARTVHRRPYVTLKWAETADRKVAGPGGRPIRITDDPANQLVHELRGRSDAILIGAGTLVADDPRLTVRLPPTHASTRTPLRVVLDSRLRGLPDSYLVRSARESPVLIFYNPRRSDPARATALRSTGVELFPIENDGPMPLDAVLAELHGRNVTHLLVEPGPDLAAAFLTASLADRVWVFRAPSRVDDPTAPTASRVPYPPVAEIPVGRDTLTEFLNPASPVFFAAEPSPDFVLAAQPASTA
jgi:diaminohydroxyphosphoribosylaminopyrimidine deaminase/5-amino-6-(5-phosphoribosylamino)uracil reductase